MLIREKDDNIVIKTKDDKMTLYLKRILQRYFEVEENYSRETREAIIIQAFTRLKEALNAESNSKIQIININEKTGAIGLDITDLNGEWAFKKNTAFNKDFCDNGEETEDTIVMGNDYRLADERIPLGHIHEIADIADLQYLLDQCEVINNAHVHKNKDVLDIIKYVGSRTELDLKLLEELSGTAEQYIIHFEEQDSYVFNVVKRYINQFDKLTDNLSKRITYIKSKLDEWTELDEVITYANTRNVELKNELGHLYHNYLSKSEYAILKEVLESVPYVQLEEDYEPTQSFKIIYKKDGEEERTKFILESEETINISGTELANVYGHNLNNANMEVFLNYKDSNNEDCRENLPFMMNIDDNINDTLNMTYITTSGNKLKILANRMLELPYEFNSDRKLHFSYFVGSTNPEITDEYSNSVSVGYKSVDYETSSISFNDIVDYTPTESMSVTFNNYNINLSYTTTYIDSIADPWDNWVALSITNNNGAPLNYGVRLIKRFYLNGEPTTDWEFVDIGLFDNYQDGVNAPYTWYEYTPVQTDPIVAIKGRCTNYVDTQTNTEETYEVITKYGYEGIEEVGYKFQIFSSISELEGFTDDQLEDVTYGSFQEAPELKINIYDHNLDRHDIKIGILPVENLTQNTETTVNKYCKVKYTKLNDRERRYIINIKRPFDEGIYFESLGNDFTVKDFNEYMTKNNFKLAKDLDYVKIIYSPDKSNEYGGKLIESNNELSIINEDGTISPLIESDYTDEDIQGITIQDFIGYYPLSKLGDILDSASIHYQMFNVPGKGENG